MAKVSVIVPVYNVEQYISVCLDSILNQTYEDIEVICINDGSTDSSKSILEQYQKFDSRIKIFNQKNSGLSAARNRGMEKACGEYILFVDSDDYVSSFAVEFTLNNALRNFSNIVLFDYMMGNSNYTKVHALTIPKYNKHYENNSFSIDTMGSESYKFIPIPTWAKLYKTDFLKENNIKFIENLYYEDLPFWAEVYTKAKRITYLCEHLYFYNTGRNTSIMKQNDAKIFDAIIAYKTVINTFKESGYWEKYKHEINSFMAADALKKFEKIRPQFKKRFFEELKTFCAEIDFENYKPGDWTDFEIDKIRKFQTFKPES